MPSARLRLSYFELLNWSLSSVSVFLLKHYLTNMTSCAVKYCYQDAFTELFLLSASAVSQQVLIDDLVMHPLKSSLGTKPKMPDAMMLLQSLKMVATNKPILKVSESQISLLPSF